MTQDAYLNSTYRSKLDHTIYICVKEHLKLDEDGQVEFKSSAGAFTRLYAFFSQILPYGNPRWEKLSIFHSNREVEAGCAHPGQQQP